MVADVRGTRGRLLQHLGGPRGAPGAPPGGARRRRPRRQRGGGAAARAAGRARWTGRLATHGGVGSRGVGYRALRGTARLRARASSPWSSSRAGAGGAGLRRRGRAIADSSRSAARWRATSCPTASSGTTTRPRGASARPLLAGKSLVRWTPRALRLPEFRLPRAGHARGGGGSRAGVAGGLSRVCRGGMVYRRLYWGCPPYISWPPSTGGRRGSRCPQFESPSPTATRRPFRTTSSRRLPTTSPPAGSPTRPTGGWC